LDVVDGGVLVELLPERLAQLPFALLLEAAADLSSIEDDSSAGDLPCSECLSPGRGEDRFGLAGDGAEAVDDVLQAVLSCPRERSPEPPDGLRELAQPGSDLCDELAELAQSRDGAQDAQDNVEGIPFPAERHIEDLGTRQDGSRGDAEGEADRTEKGQ